MSDQAACEKPTRGVYGDVGPCAKSAGHRGKCDPVDRRPVSDQARLAEIERRLARMAFGRVGSYGDDAIGQLLVDARDLLAALREAERQRDEAAAAIRACILDAEGQEAVTADKGLELTKGQVQILHRGLLAASRGVEGELLRGGFAGSDASGSVEVGADAVAAAARRAEEAESKLATATDTIRSLTALVSERETT